MSDRLIYWSSTTSSTNDQALSSIGAPEGAVWLTDHQTAGRGRRTEAGPRAWLSAPGASILMSMRFCPRLAPEATPALTLAAAVGVAEALRAATGVAVGLKWPNDLLVGGRKLGGILTEGRLDGESMIVVVGVGINVNAEAGALPPSLAGQATSLQAEAGRPLDRLALVGQIAAALEASVAAVVDHGGLGGVRSRWEALSVMAGRRVRFQAPGAAGEAGEAMGLSEAGGLLVRRQSGAVVEVCAGEVDFEEA